MKVAQEDMKIKEIIIVNTLSDDRKPCHILSLKEATNIGKLNNLI